MIFSMARLKERFLWGEKNKMEEIRLLAQSVKKASRKINNASYKLRHSALLKMSDALISNIQYILDENEKDLKAAREKKISEGLYDRLRLTKERIEDIANAILKVHDLPDVLGEVSEMVKRPNGLSIGKKAVPLGVVAIIYEARPNVTADAAALCIKTGNAVILRGGSDAINSNKALVKVLREAICDIFPKEIITLLENTDRESAKALMTQNEYIDVLIPRGGAGLIKSVVENATVPVIETGTGNCHIFVDETANFEMAEKIIINAKTQRTGVCNAAESLVIHQNIAGDFLPRIFKALSEKGVKIYGCEKTREFIDVFPADDEIFAKEFLALEISVKLAENIDDAIEHINSFSTGHSEAIITESYKNSQKFLDEIDSAAVYVNASTRFTDGGEFGFGAEIGISTQKLHARGPMGLGALTSTKYVIYGDGQTR